MHEPLRPVWAEINLDNFKKNLQLVRGLVPATSQMLAVVKANAYGIGSVAASKAALEVPGVAGLAVATPDEAVELRSAGLTPMILVLGPGTAKAARALTELDVSMTVTSVQGIRDAEEAGKAVGKKAKVHIKVETGMGRIGFIPGPNLQEGLELVSKCSYIEAEGMFSHFSAADTNKEYTKYQWSNFQNAMKQVKQAKIPVRYFHTSNSAAILDPAVPHLDLVRPGIMLYGCYPDPSLADKARLYPVFALKAQISHIKRVEPETYIGYGMTYKTSKPATIATIPVGYADGFPRLLSNRGSVLIKGVRYPIVGRICMDQLMINLGAQTECKVGDVVTLIGSDGAETITLDEVAGLASTISHEILTGVAPRVPRVYVGN